MPFCMPLRMHGSHSSQLKGGFSQEKHNKFAISEGFCQSILPHVFQFCVSHPIKEHTVQSISSNRHKIAWKTFQRKFNNFQTKIFGPSLKHGRLYIFVKYSCAKSCGIFTTDVLGRTACKIVEKSLTFFKWFFFEWFLNENHSQASGGLAFQDVLYRKGLGIVELEIQIQNSNTKF